MSTFFIIPVFYFDLSTSHKSFLFTFMGQIQTKPFLFHVYETNTNKTFPVSRLWDKYTQNLSCLTFMRQIQTKPFLFHVYETNIHKTFPV